MLKFETSSGQEIWVRPDEIEVIWALSSTICEIHAGSSFWVVKGSASSIADKVRFHSNNLDGATRHPEAMRG